jgi:hypothetical protein
MDANRRYVVAVGLQDKGPFLLETRLYLKEATKEKFRRYSVVAENSLAKIKHDVDLVQGGLLW